ncbi:DUF983 domain-containing protein [Hymenobacter jeollabukensis]|nr:DUF983 domain-containing protein [Hymenobacter jeollabukensis]
MAAPDSSKLALLQLKCPRCHEGPLFTHSAWHLSKFSDMPESCPVCGQTYEPEPGFYYGAMYISFGFAVATFAVCGVLLYYLAGDPSLWVYVTTVAAVTLLTAPLVYRYSRALMLYLFGGVHYDPRRQPGRAGTPLPTRG